MAQGLFKQAGFAIHLPFLLARFIHPATRSWSSTNWSHTDNKEKPPEGLPLEVFGIVIDVEQYKRTEAFAFYMATPKWMCTIPHHQTHTTYPHLCPHKNKTI